MVEELVLARVGGNLQHCCSVIQTWVMSLGIDDDSKVFTIFLIRINKLHHLRIMCFTKFEKNCKFLLFYCYLSFIWSKKGEKNAYQM